MKTFKHFIDLKFLDRPTITALLNRADELLVNFVNKNKVLDILNGQVVVNLFFEPSTRTSNSFAIAAHRLGAMVLSPHMPHSATVKGESLIDTVQTFEALGANVLIVRHQENHTPSLLAAELKQNAHIVNAGDGKNQHPSQALIDLMTIRQYKQRLDNLSVAIVGDITHSRVARSLTDGLRMMGTSDIRLIAPKGLLPENDKTYEGMQQFSRLSDGLKEADVVVALRLQKERMEQHTLLSITDFFNEYGITAGTIKLAKPDAIVMHPGPMNRGVEIESAVADGQQSVILQQVRNGVPVRMAIIEALCAA